MRFRALLLKSSDYLDKNPKYIEKGLSSSVFLLGAKWMSDRLNELDSDKQGAFDFLVNYNAFGLIKYLTCLVALVLSTVLFFNMNLLLVPLSIFVFYFIEVHFLFLFPLVIDKVKDPFLMSIKYTYQLGVIKALLIVIPIGIFMVIGLFNLKKPFLNWHIGCLSVLYLYKDEVRNRI